MDTPVPNADELGLGRLQRVDPRMIWKHEALELTPWLLNHLDLLGSALGIEIIPTQREVSVGSFSLDLLGEDPQGRPVIIENQLDPTNHNHLGQLIVYASGLDAAVVVWITPQFRDEHRQALDWLNERTDSQVDFFGVELDVVRIGSSPAAPIFRVVARPNDWQKAIRRPTGLSGTAQSRHDFFEGVLDQMVKDRPTFRRPKVGYEGWVGMASGPFGYYSVSFAAGGLLRTEAYLDTGDVDSTSQLFKNLEADRAEIEAEFGQELSWESLEGKRASRVAVYRTAPDLTDEKERSETQDWAARSLLKFIDVFDRRLRSLVAALKTAKPPTLD